MAVQFKDYYETLGVSRTASADDIRKAFRNLARKHHPDMVKAKEKAAAETKFKEINEAYEVLGDADKRTRYDQLGANWDQPQQPPRGRGHGSAPQGFPGGAGGGDFEFGGTGFSDFFEQFFGGQRPGGRSGGVREEAGKDVEADLAVTLEESVHGAVKPISLRRSDKTESETLNVKIPAGVREGQRIRLAGQGNKGRMGTAGDLFLNIRLSRHPHFDIEGNDLVHDIELEPWQLVLGTEVQVPTIERQFLKVKVPPGTQHGQRFRLRQRGMGKEGARGDLFVEVRVTIPRTLSDDAKAAWEELRKSSQR